MKKIILRIIFWLLLVPIFLFSLLSFIFWFFKTPSNDQNWEFGQQKQQKIEINGQNILIKDLRDYRWTEKDGKIENYKDMKFSLADIVSLEVGVSHFSALEAIGHVFLIFNLKDGRSVALSIEARRSDGEEFTILKGLTFDYEIIYLLTTKEDLLSLREKRGERVYVYPLKTNHEIAQKLFLEIAQKVNELYQRPEFYHLFFKNCTNGITREVEKISDKVFPFYEKTFAPGYADKALYKMGLIKNKEESFVKTKEKYLWRAI